MALTSDLVKGMIISYNNEPHLIVEREFYAGGKGGSMNRCKLKSIKSGKVVSVTFRTGIKVEELEITTKDFQFMYADSDNAYFMDPKTFDQVAVSLDLVPGRTDYLHSDARYMLKFYEGDVIFVQIPAKMTLEVIEAYDAVKGNSANNPQKEVTLETGVKVMVPMFIKQGEKIIINTETGTYFSKE